MARRKALIPISSARLLPLSEPAGQSISTGFFLIELAAVLKEFESTHDFVFATPDGQVPQLDINGLGLSFHAVEGIGAAAVRTLLEQGRSSFTPQKFRDRHPQWVARRSQELELVRRHLGRLPVSENLPNTDKEAADFRPTVVKALEQLDEQKFFSFEGLVRRHRDEADPFTLRDFDFLHAPGGHAPMVDFRDNPWFGELLHLSRENELVTSLICHAPVALTSTAQRVDLNGQPYTPAANPFHGTKVAVAGKRGEKTMLRTGYPHVPGHRTELTYFVDEALEQAGFPVAGTIIPGGVKIQYDPALRLLTGNGPQTVDRQAARLCTLLADQR